MTQTEFFALVGFLILVVGTITGVWWRIEGKIKEAKHETAATAAAALAQANLALQQLSEFRIHVAEHYTSKAHLAEMTRSIMSAIEGVKDGLDRLNARVDGVIDHRRHED